MKKKNILKSALPYIIAIASFWLFTIWYCSPMLNGKVLNAGDTTNWEGMAHQSIEYTKQTGEHCWWVTSMFSGMPTYQIDAHIPSHLLSHSLIGNIISLGLNDTMGVIFSYLLCFFILLRCFGIDPWLSIIGAFATALSSYFFIILPAGHVTKAMAIGFLAPLIGGTHLIFKQKYWIGIPIVLIFGITSIVRHPQMTYYVGLLIAILICAELYNPIKSREWSRIGINIGILSISLLLILGSKICWFSLNTEYLKETMRGGHSELAKTENQSQSNGLNIQYATDWSYGINETMTLLIPNYMGGASGYNIGTESPLYKEMTKAGVPSKSAKQFCQSAPTYWGEKPFTSGPVYVGAIICFLFVLGLIIVKTPFKWALLAATILSILLAWGKNFMPLTEFFFNHFPMYNKFRAVESILIIAEITIPLLAMLAVKQIVEDNGNLKKYFKPIVIAASCTAGLCLFFCLLGDWACSFVSSYDDNWKAQVGNDIYNMIVNQRASLLKNDAWRSFVFILLSLGLLILYINKKIKTGYMYAILGLLILVDLTIVDRRFFGEKNFIKESSSKQYFAMQPWEEQILQDKSPNYRVLNVAANTFNDSRTSYRLQSIGGYHAAKLRRYQDLIEAHISQNNMNVINMLNTKYIITSKGVMQNPEAMGCAWFVENVKFVTTPQEESEALYNTDLKKTAIADKAFETILQTKETTSQASIEITKFTPDNMEYKTSSQEDKVCVFSEVYYPGWHLYVDDKETEIGRVNYILRAAVIPAGNHTLKMEFRPKGLNSDKFAMGIDILIIIFSILSVSWHYYKKYKTVI